MQNYWKTALLVIILVFLAGSGFFYYMGGFNSDNTSNITIVRRIINSKNDAQTQKNTQIDQAISSINNDIAKAGDSSKDSILNEITQDLKSF